MRCLLPVLVLLLCACQTSRQVTLPNGATYTDNGHLAGDTLVLMEPDGTVILRNKMNKPWQDFLQAIGTMYAAHGVASVSKAQVTSREAIRLGAQKERVATRAIDAGVEKLGIETAADIEKLRIITPINPP
jgi:hypothetical protein